MVRQLGENSTPDKEIKAKALLRMTQQWLTYWILMVGLSFISVHFQWLWELVFDN